MNQPQTARKLANRLLIKAKENEPKITEDLRNIAKEVSAKMVGLDNKFKSEESLVRKFLLLTKRDKSLETFEQKLQKHSQRNNDTLRYTFILSFETYYKKFDDITTKLKLKGFKIPYTRIWNAWQNEGNFRDTGYRGINITVISSQKQKFEIQFHTEESYLFKNETHPLYEELRKMETSFNRRKEIITEMRELGKNVKRPKDI